MPSVPLYDRTGRIYQVPYESGWRIRDILRHNRIPLSGIIARRNNAIVVEDELATPDVVLEMVRAYPLYEILTLPAVISRVRHPVYAKHYYTFNEGGQLVHSLVQFTAETLREYVESVARDVCERMFALGHKVVLGLSGGRDSTALLLLLERLGLLKDMTIRCVTVDFGYAREQGPTIEYATRLAYSLALDHVQVRPEQVQHMLGLRVPFLEVLNCLETSTKRDLAVLVIGHALYQSLETMADTFSTDVIWLGHNLEDLVGNLIGVYTTGHLNLAPRPIHRWGPYTYVSPLWQLTKKELTLYLKLHYPDYTEQVTSIRETDLPNIGLLMASGDLLDEVWPGIGYHLLVGFERLAQYLEGAVRFSRCENCKRPFVAEKGVWGESVESLCDVCALFEDLGVLERRRGRR